MPKQNKILVLGGYGGENVGDDAQLAGALMDLRTAIPEATLVVLTPELEKTARRHKLGAVGYASRVSFFDFDSNWRRYNHFSSNENEEWLKERGEFVVRESRLLSEGKPHKLSRKQLVLVDEIRSARMIYYAGGGYMMGPTASRLWDAMIVCRVAALFETPVVMSGQNIGVWIRDYDRESASAGFPLVSVIGTRDDTFSRRDLTEIGVSGDHIMATHDDAFFVPPSSKKVSDYILRRVGISPNVPFISLSIHKPDGAIDILQAIRSASDKPIVMVPTCPPDQKPQAALYEKAIEAGIRNVHIVRKLHEYDEVKGIIGSAYACISSRHHPIIFALGHAVPSISMNFSDYFNAKNFGAMDLCGIGRFSVDVTKTRNIGDLIGERLKVLLQEHDQISETIRNSHNTLHGRKRRFIIAVRNVWDSTEPKEREKMHISWLESILGSRSGHLRLIKKVRPQRHSRDA